MSKGLKIFLIILAVVVVVFIIRRLRKPDSSQNNLPSSNAVGDSLEAVSASQFNPVQSVDLTDSGNAVKAVQIILKNYFGAGIVVDGSFGSGTMQALNNVGVGAPISPLQLWGELPGNTNWFGVIKQMPNYLNQLETAIANFQTSESGW